MLFLPVTVHVEVSRRVEIIPIRASSAIRPELRHMTSRLSAAPTELLGPSLLVLDHDHDRHICETFLNREPLPNMGFFGGRRRPHHDKTTDWRLIFQGILLLLPGLAFSVLCVNLESCLIYAAVHVTVYSSI